MTSMLKFLKKYSALIVILLTYIGALISISVNRGNEFVLTDLSMNGTFIHVNGKKSIALIKEQADEGTWHPLPNDFME